MTVNSSIRVLPKTVLRLSIGLCVLVGLLVYAFLYDNSTSLSTAAGYGWTHLLNLPRQVRFIEIGVVGVVLLFLLTRPVSRLTRNLLIASLVFTFLAAMSYLATRLAQLQVVGP